MRNMRIKVRGKYYDLQFVELSERASGLCDPPDAVGKRIRIDNRGTDLEILEALIHEAWHACDWDKDEDAVAEGSRDIAVLLWRQGLRFTEE
jgi:hypothetical protein